MKTNDQIRTAVLKRYEAVALSDKQGCGCGAQSCCTPQSSAPELSAQLGYSAEEMSNVPEGANIGLGCGNPQAIANLRRGETVVDLGSGGGFDCFLAALQVGEEGHVIGIDMTPTMISRARENLLNTPHKNVEFRLGEIEYLPVADNTADIIISNCVINLSPDKKQVFREAYRVLKPDGRLAVSDVVATRAFPEELKRDLDKHAGCVGGAALVDDLRLMLAAAGFTDIRITLKAGSREFIKNWFPGSGLENYVASAAIEAVKSNK
ncbi:MAG: arsenite methyltransferase [Deltaproteobacteria bacterium]|nr:arsenite methyltransferase [Deltaproteobacteria bacterium]